MLRCEMAPAAAHRSQSPEKVYENRMLMPPTPLLETERLRLRPIVVADAPAIQRRFARWEIVRFLADVVPWPYPADGAAGFVATALAEMASGQQSHWGLWLEGGPAEVIGVISLRPPGPVEHGQRGFWLDSEFQGQGLMTEAADAVTDYALITLGWPELRLTNASDNTGSSRVKARQGAQLVGLDRGRYVSGEADREVWRLTREAWLARRR